MVSNIRMISFYNVNEPIELLTEFDATQDEHGNNIECIWLFWSGIIFELNRRVWISTSILMIKTIQAEIKLVRIAMIDKSNKCSRQFNTH